MGFFTSTVGIGVILLVLISLVVLGIWYRSEEQKQRRLNARNERARLKEEEKRAVELVRKDGDRALIEAPELIIAHIYATEIDSWVKSHIQRRNVSKWLISNLNERHVITWIILGLSNPNVSAWFRSVRRQPEIQDWIGWNWKIIEPQARLLGHLELFQIVDRADPNEMTHEYGWGNQVTDLIPQQAERGGTRDAPIWGAVTNGDLESVKELLPRLRNLGGVNIVDGEGYTPIMLAVFYFHDELAKYLIEQGADVNHRNDFGETVLSHSISRGIHRPDIVRLLIDAGAAASVNAQDHRGVTALMQASRGGKDFVGFEESEKSIEVVRILLEVGADPSLVAHDGNTALSIAEDLGNERILRLLGGKAHVEEPLEASPQQNISPENLTEELISIGRAKSHPKAYSGFYIRGANDDFIEEPRAREIGRQLYDLGGRKIDLMKETHSIVASRLGQDAGTELEGCWHNIGFDEWQRGEGECWMR